MAGNWDQHCAICASQDIRGELCVVHERGPEQARAREELEVVRLCTCCFGFVAEAHQAAAGGPSGLQPWDDLAPPRDRPTVGCCSVCAGPLQTEAFAVELTPHPSADTDAPLRRLVDHPSRYRLCRSCLAWTRELLDTESVAHWGRRRGADPASANGPLPGKGAALGLDGADRETARATLVGLGAAWDSAAPTAAAGATTVQFVEAGRGGEATAFVRGLPWADRRRVVVVARPATLDDAAGALRAGAGDLLASPLSRQQVAGALDRISGDADWPRDPATGLPQYALEPRFGLPAHLLRIEVPPGSTPLDTVLVLRRFLRGYDRVSARGDDIEVHVYCPGDHLGAVVRRVARLLGAAYRIEACGMADVPEAATPTAASPLPAAASAFFGRALGRTA